MTRSLSQPCAIPAENILTEADQIFRKWSNKGYLKYRYSGKDTDVLVAQKHIDGIYKHTIMVRNDEDKVANLVKQIEKKIDVLKVFCYSPNEVVLQELALYKVKRSRNVEDLVRRHNVRILDIHDEYIVLEKTGHREEIRELYKMLAPYGVNQFVCSGQVAIIKSRSELLDEYLSLVDERQRQLNSEK